MTVLEIFMSFAKRLPAERLHSIEAALATMMETYSERHEFTAAELDVIDQRVAEPEPRYASSKDITKLLGRPPSK